MRGKCIILTLILLFTLVINTQYPSTVHAQTLNWQSTFVPSIDSIVSNGTGYAATASSASGISFCAASSADGINWSVNQGMQDLEYVIWDGTRYLAGHRWHTEIYQSNDGYNYSLVKSYSNMGSGLSAMDSSGSYYAITRVNLIYTTSSISDLYVTEEMQTSKIEIGSLNDIKWVGNKFIATGFDYSMPAMITGVKGGTWVKQYLPSSIMPLHIVWDGRNTVIIGTQISTDNGSTWSNANYPFNARVVAFGNGTFYAASDQKKIYTSSDGRVWQEYCDAPFIPNNIVVTKNRILIESNGKIAVAKINKPPLLSISGPVEGSMYSKLDAYGIEIRWDCSDPDNDPLVSTIYLNNTYANTVSGSGALSTVLNTQNINGYCTIKIVLSDGTELVSSQRTIYINPDAPLNYIIAKPWDLTNINAVSVYDKNKILDCQGSRSYLSNMKSILDKYNITLNYVTAVENKAFLEACLGNRVKVIVD